MILNLTIYKVLLHAAAGFRIDCMITFSYYRYLGTRMKIGVPRPHNIINMPCLFFHYLNSWRIGCNSEIFYCESGKTLFLAEFYHQQSRHGCSYWNRPQLNQGGRKGKNRSTRAIKNVSEDGKGAFDAC